MSLRTLLVKKTDDLFSLSIRMETKRIYGRMCVFCGKKPIQCCFHFQTRSLYATRWHYGNSIGSCHGCNMRNEYEPGPFIRWYMERFGMPQYDELMARSHEIRKFGNDDLNGLCRDFRRDLERGEVKADTFTCFSRNRPLTNNLI